MSRSNLIYSFLLFTILYVNVQDKLSRLLIFTVVSKLVLIYTNSCIVVSHTNLNPVVEVFTFFLKHQDTQDNDKCR